MSAPELLAACGIHMDPNGQHAACPPCETHHPALQRHAPYCCTAVHRHILCSWHKGQQELIAYLRLTCGLRSFRGRLAPRGPYMCASHFLPLTCCSYVA